MCTASLVCDKEARGLGGLGEKLLAFKVMGSGQEAVKAI